ncbi:MAG: hypothetical protein ABI171_18400 [Collimonas sp.]|uniref:hypothetical protein n=1 Tax=Collimonas sp. TaxID=1963772 RepID=UPI003262DBB2
MSGIHETALKCEGKSDRLYYAFSEIQATLRLQVIHQSLTPHHFNNVTTDKLEHVVSKVVFTGMRDMASSVRAVMVKL